MYKDSKGIPRKKFFNELKYDTFVGKPKQEVIAQWNDDTYLDNDGNLGMAGGLIVRWKKSNNIVPEDFLYDFRDLGFITDEHITASLAQNSIEQKKHIEEYITSLENFKKNEPELYEEQQREMMFEASAAMGPGEEMVNIFTGDTFTTR